MTQSPRGFYVLPHMAAMLFSSLLPHCLQRHFAPLLMPRFLLWLQRQVINQKPTSNPTKFIASFRCYPIFPPRTTDKLECSVLRITTKADPSSLSFR